MATRKPESQIYHTVLENLHAQRHATIFLDDNPENQLGEQKQGIHTLQMESFIQLKTALKNTGIID
jgi:putative hydrolase of the HAD superfamily